jgi:FixJ family two-component response regulator
VEARANLTAPGSGLILSSRQRRIVAVVDDDLGTRVSVARLLGALGYGTETFDSAEAFLDNAPKSEASCLVLDIQLGDITGIELARQLKAEGFKYPVIFITARDDEQVRRQAQAAGCVAFLIKPFAAKSLIDAINLATGWSIEHPPRDVAP